jgi:hypothetical protein
VAVRRVSVSPFARCEVSIPFVCRRGVRLGGSHAFRVCLCVYRGDNDTSPHTNAIAYRGVMVPS